MGSSEIKQTEFVSVCPHLGLANDRGSHFSFPETAHFCFAAEEAAPITLEHQSTFCLTQNCRSCPRFVEPSFKSRSVSASSVPATGAKIQRASSAKLWRAALLGMAGVLVGLLIILGVFYYNGFAPQPDPANDSLSQLAPSPTANLTTTPMPSESTAEDTATPASVAFLATPTATATPLPGSQIYMLSPAAGDIGWVTSDEELGNHFGDSFLYVGIYDGKIYQGAFQFDLSSIPRGAPIHRASLQLTGLRDDRLGLHDDQTGAAGTWVLHLLASEIDQGWRTRNFQSIFNAETLQSLNPVLGEQDLAVGRLNRFTLSAEQIEILKTRVIEDEEPKVSFRVEGPLVGPDNIFAWDTGYGPESQSNKVTLLLEVGEPPATLPPYEYVVVTSTPTPENVVTAAAIVLQMTAEATRIGTATPAPPNMATATPIPDYLVVTSTPNPENEATVQALIVIATAEALTTGTPAPLPTNVVTATPTPTETPTPTPDYVMITAVPTAESIFAAATMSLAATAQAQINGTSTPLPANWVTPIVVTTTPSPANEATAQVIAEMATAIAVTTGTPTPFPSNVVIATPTPVFEPIPLLFTPTPGPSLPIVQPIPSALLGKVLFRSDREGSDTVYIYVYDPETGKLGRLTDSWPYDVAVARDSWSADQRFRVFTKDAVRYKNIADSNGEVVGAEKEDVPALYLYDYLYKVEEQLTEFGTGIAYGGVWSPTTEQIAFISNDSGDDEIWVVNRDGSNLRQLTSSNELYNAREIGKDTFIPEQSKYPSWSPDGTKIIFTSNRIGNQQLWIMNADGSDQRLLMGWDNWTPYNDWAPVWVKHQDPVPILESVPLESQNNKNTGSGSPSR